MRARSGAVQLDIKVDWGVDLPVRITRACLGEATIAYSIAAPEVGFV